MAPKAPGGIIYSQLVYLSALLPWWLTCVKNRLPKQQMRVQSLGQEDGLEKEMATTPISLPGKSHGQRSLVGYSPRGHKRVEHK